MSLIVVVIRKLLEPVKTQWPAFTLVLLCIISILSLYPLGELPRVPGSDKTHHFIAYSALVFPVALAKPRHWLLIVVALLVYSGLIELIQPYVNRYGEWRDLGANAIGLMVGAVLASLVNKVSELESSQVESS